MQAGRIVLAAALALLVVVAATACGSSHSQIALKISVTRYVPTKIHSGGRTYIRPERTSARFTLNCQPTSGTIPFAARLCRDIARHR